MPYEFLAKNGLISQGNVTVTGSLITSQNVTASNISASGTSSFGIVGIGTVNPAYKLDVNGNANFTNGFYTNTDASSTSYFVGANGTRPIIFQNNTATSYDFGFKFTDSNTFTIVGGNTLANPTTDLVSFTYDGKVGIGTTGPSVRLHLVTGSIGGTAYPLYVDNNSGGAGVNVVGIGFANGGILKHSITTAIYGNDYMAFNIGQGASYNQERMRIDSNGNVGIGTTIPSQKLHIKSTDTFAAIKFTNSVSDAGIISYSSDNLYFYTANAQRITIDTAGNVGIGTTSPGALLDVSYGDYQNAGTIRIGADIGVSISRTNNTRKYGAITGFPYNNASASIQVIGIDAQGPTITGLTIGGGGTGFASPTQIQFYTTSSILIPGAERMRITADGAVGIGTTNPVAKLQVAGNISGSSFTSSISNAVGFLGTASWANNVVSASFATTAQTANALNSANSYTITNLTASGVVKASQIAEKVVTFTPLTGSLTGAPAWYRIISGSGVADYGRVRLSTTFDNSRSDLEFTYGVRNYDIDGAGAFINITRASTYNSVFNAVRVIEGTLTTPYAIDVLIGNYLNNTTPGTVSCLYESQFQGAILDTPTFVSASETGSSSNVVKTVYTTYTSGYPRVGPVYSDGLSVATYQGQLSVGYRGNYNYGSPSTNNYALLVSGSVGIGTTSPSYKLDVSGSIRAAEGEIIATGNNAAFRIYRTTGINYLDWASGQNLYLGTVTSEGGAGRSNKMVILDNGNVGIGTTNPSSRLHISGSSSTAITITDDALYTNSITNDNSVMTYTVDTGNAAASSAAHIFKRFNTELVRITHEGRVGVGTSIPATGFLDVRSNQSKSLAGPTSIAFFGSNDAANPLGLAVNHESSSGVKMVGLVGTEYGSSGNNIKINETIHVQYTGNVGIRTINPVATLQVAGNVSGSSFTSSISNAVGFLGTSSWAQNVVSASYALTSSVATSETLATVTGRGASTSTQITVATAAGGSMYTGRKAGSSYGDGVSGATFKSITDNSQSFATSYAFASYYSGSSGINSFYVSSNGDGYFSGSVGIGTTIPNSKLEIAGPAGTGVVSVTNSGNGRSGSFGIDGNGVFIKNSNNGDYFDLENASGTSKFRVVYDNNTFLNTTFTSVGSLTASGSKLSVFGNLSVGSTYGAITASSNGAIFEGDVGIGTTTPTAQSNYRFLQVNGTNSAVIEALVGGTRIGGIDSDSTNLYVGSIGSYPIVFRTAVNEKMRITAAGLVGIGTSSPAQKLEVQSGSVLIRGDGTALFGTYYASAGENTFFTLHSGSGNTFHIGNDVSGTNYNTMVFTAATDSTGGKVGIGTSSPVAKLQVAGNISGSSFTSSISNAVGFLGTSSWAQNVVSASFATTAQTANALNTSNNYQVNSIGVNIAGSGTAGRIGTNELGVRSWSITPTGGRLLFESGDGNGSVYFVFPVSASTFVGAGTGLTGTAASLTAGTANALNASNTYTVAGLTSAYVDVTGAGTIPTTGIYRPSTKTLGLSADGTLIFKISNVSAPATSSIETGNFLVQTGNVGIGTTTPGALLELSSSTAASLLNIKGARGNNILYVSGSGNIGINSIAFDPLAPEALLISGSTYNIISADTNINTYGQIHTHNRNAGTAASSDLVATNNTGNEIGNYVDLGINSSGYTAAFIGNANDGYLYNTGSQFYIGNASPGRNLYFFAGGTSNTASMMLSASGNVGIGATSPNAKLDVRGYIVSDVNGNAVESGFYLGSSAHGIRRPVASNDVYLHTTTGNLYLGTTGNTSQQVTVLNSGNVGIGTVTPAAKLEISGSGNSALLNIKSPISGAILYVSGSGAVGINTSTVGAFTLQVNGSFGATTKSFIIDHPTKAGKKLMYGSLESPYHGIRLTGRDTLKEGKCKVELPDYIYKLILHDSVNIQLTGIKCNKTLYVDDINIPENYFTIAYDKAIFESYKDYDFFWDFTAIRADVPELTTEL
jgi:hypothetical protein